MVTIDEVVSRLRAEFVEMPGLRLRSEQVQRLCGIERTMCRMALEALVNEKFLRVKTDGHYVRVTNGRLIQPVLKADVRAMRSVLKAS